MGGGSWSSSTFTSYSTSRGRTVNTTSAGIVLDSNLNAQDIYTVRSLDPVLNPYKVMRECRDSDEHPNTIPVILALDVTGSMGSAASEVAKKLNIIMTNLYTKVKDVEFLIMGIGDLYYDRAPIQASQFESDIRIAEQLDKIYFEGGGGGNAYESYTAAWYFGLHHTDLDCWKRGKKGIIITLGDEPLNPYLQKNKIYEILGDNVQADIETPELYNEVTEKFDIYHLAIDNIHSSYSWHKNRIKSTWPKLLGNNFKVANLDNLASIIVDIVEKSSNNINDTSEIITVKDEDNSVKLNDAGEITW